MSHEVPPLDDTESLINSIYHEVLLMGANDTEPDQFEELITRWKKGEFTDQEAVEEAYRIQARKQDYH